MNYRRDNLPKRTIVIVYILLAMALVFYVYNTRNDFLPLLTIDIKYIVLLMVLSVASPLTVFITRKICIQTLGINLECIDYLGLPSVSNLLSYILPLRTDLVVSATYYKRKCGLAYSGFVSVIAFENILAVLLWLLLCVIGLFVVGIRHAVWPSLIWMGLGIACFGGTTIFIVASKLPERQRINKVMRFLDDASKGFRILLCHPSKIIVIVVLLIMNALIQAIRLSIGFYVLGHSITFETVLVCSTITILIDIFAIVPGNLGIKEAVSGFSAFLLGNSLDAGIQAMLLVRISGFIVYLIAGLGWMYPVHKTLKLTAQESSGE